MADFNLNNFITKITKTGVAKTNRFEVRITPPLALQAFKNDGELVSLYCDISNLPGMSVITKGLRLFGPAYQRPISSEFNGEAINMTFYLDRDMHVKAFFDAWMFKTVNPNSFNVSYASEYACDIKISQLDENDKPTYSVYLQDAFPRAMSLVDLSSGATNQAGRLNMTFAYRRWFSRHPSYTGSKAKTTFPPLRSTSSPPTTGAGDGATNLPFRVDINGTNSSSSQ